VGKHSGSTVREVLTKPQARLGTLLIAVVIIIATGAVAFLTEQDAIEARDWVVHSYEMRHALSRLEVQRAEARAGAFGYLLRHDPGDLAYLDQQTGLMMETVASLRAQAQDNPRQVARVEQLEPLAAQQAKQWKDCVLREKCALSNMSGGNALEGMPEREMQISQLTAAMDKEEEDLLRGRLQTWNTLFRRNLLTISVSLAIALLLLIYSFRLLNAEVATRKEMEKLALENTESYRTLSARILELQDLERRKIARELHDSVGQYLAGLKMNLGQISSGKAALAGSPEWLTETLDMTERALGEIRTISHLLHPPLLDELGFESAARWYVQEFAKRSGTQVNLEIAEIVERLPRGIELALFRVLQESLTNVHRHANAQKVDVRVTCREGEVSVEVLDDGKGIPPRVLQQFQAGGAAGIGLAGMRERLMELGGTLEVESGTRGSKVRATLPTTLCDADDETSVSAFNAAD
jgi:signal transduction histidine kinase